MDLNDSPFQVFTKDIGFVIENIMFISNMKESVRQIEIDKLIEVSLNNDIKVYHMKSKVEGWDILVHIGNNNVLCCNKNLNNMILSRGYNSILIDFSEIIKAKGSIGCCVLELLRGDD